MAKRSKKRLDPIEAELAKLEKYIPNTRDNISKHRGNAGWGLGFTTAYRARKAIRRAKSR